MESGIKVADEVVTTFTEIKLRKTFKWAVLGISDDYVKLVTTGSGDAEALHEALPKDDCAFALFDNGRHVVLFMYASPNATTNARTIYSTTKQTVEKSLDGVKVHKNLVEDKDEVADAVK